MAHVRTSPAGMWHFVRAAPLTYLWLVVLLITTVIQHFIGRRWHAVLIDQSTNLHHLVTNPLEVLVSSLLWIDGRYWVPYLVLFTLFLAPAEHWLGQRRWLAVGLIAHVGATYISQGVLYLLISRHEEPQWLVYARDIGVSYFLLGVMAVLAYHIGSPWRWPYLALLVVIVVVPLIIEPDFTSIGHVAAVPLGLACYGLTHRRPHRPG